VESVGRGRMNRAAVVAVMAVLGAAGPGLALVRHVPPLIEQGLWPAQITAIKNLEQSLAANKPRALI